MKYLKNPETNQIIKGNSFGDYFNSWQELTQAEIDAYELEKAKETKIIQLKANRDSALNEPLTSKKAFEYDIEVNQVLDNEVYFEFSTKPTNNPLTEPANLLFTALFGTNIAYSCNIIEGESTRKGYVQITQSLAQSLSVHLQDRANNYIQEANRIETLIEACETLEELENININFS